MVQHPQRVYPGDPGMRPGLPVDPPEVDPVVLQRPMQHLEIRREEFWIRHIEGDRIPGGRIDSQRPRPWPDRGPRTP